MTLVGPNVEAPHASRAGSGRLFFGWRLAGAGAVILALQSALILQAFGQYAVILREQFGWSKTTISVAFSFNRAESGLLGPIQGWALHRFGSRRVMRVGAVVMTAGFVWFSLMSSPVQFVASMFVIAIGAGLSGFLTVNTEIVRWFDRNRTRALSMTGIGIATGGLVVPVVVLVLRHLGWRETAFGSGILLGVATFALASWFGTVPADRREVVDGAAPVEGAFARRGVGDRHLTAREALRTRTFWLLAFGHASALLIVGAVIAHLSLFLTSEQGYSLQSASFVIAGIPIAQIAGMLIGGALGDRYSKRALCSGAMAGHVAGLLLVTYATNAMMVWAFVVLHGLAWGMRGPLMSAIRADYFGSTAFGQIMGYTSIILMFGMVGGPLFAGVLADVTGSYRTGFTVLAAISALGAVFFAFATPPEHSTASARSSRCSSETLSRADLTRSSTTSRRRTTGGARRYRS